MVCMRCSDIEGNFWGEHSNVSMDESNLQWNRMHLDRFCYHPLNICERDVYLGCCVCVWDGIFLGEHTDLHVVPRETMNAQTYGGDILDAYVCAYSGGNRRWFIVTLWQCRQRKALLAYDYLQQKTIRRIE